MASIPFAKMNGLGNDFIVVSLPATRRAELVSSSTGSLHHPAAIPLQERAAPGEWNRIQHLSQRGGKPGSVAGGCDQFIIVAPEIADISPAPPSVFMWVFNGSDGDEVGMCGNAARCVALHHVIGAEYQLAAPSPGAAFDTVKGFVADLVAAHYKDALSNPPMHAFEIPDIFFKHIGIEANPTSTRRHYDSSSSEDDGNADAKPEAPPPSPPPPFQYAVKIVLPFAGRELSCVIPLPQAFLQEWCRHPDDPQEVVHPSAKLVELLSGAPLRQCVLLPRSYPEKAAKLRAAVAYAIHAGLVQPYLRQLGTVDDVAVEMGAIPPRLLQRFAALPSRPQSSPVIPAAPPADLPRERKLRDAQMLSGVPFTPELARRHFRSSAPHLLMHLHSRVDDFGDALRHVLNIPDADNDAESCSKLFSQALLREFGIDPPEPGPAAAHAILSAVHESSRTISDYARAATISSITACDVGNPHCALVFSSKLAVRPEKRIMAVFGHVLETQCRDTLFPAGANVEFVFPTDTSTCDVIVWERGEGFTQACGSGACAAAVAAHFHRQLGQQAHHVSSQVIVLPGGTLHVDIETRLVGVEDHLAAAPIADADGDSDTLGAVAHRKLETLDAFLDDYCRPDGTDRVLRQRLPIEEPTPPPPPLPKKAPPVPKGETPTVINSDTVLRIVMKGAAVLEVEGVL